MLVLLIACTKIALLITVSIYDIFILRLLDFVWPWIRLTFCEPINNRSFLL